MKKGKKRKLDIKIFCQRKWKKVSRATKNGV
jgi:hypothetical protein